MGQIHPYCLQIRVLCLFQGNNFHQLFLVRLITKLSGIAHHRKTVAPVEKIAPFLESKSCSKPNQFGKNFEQYLSLELLNHLLKKTYLLNGV